MRMCMSCSGSNGGGGGSSGPSNNNNGGGGNGFVPSNALANTPGQNGAPSDAAPPISAHPLFPPDKVSTALSMPCCPRLNTSSELIQMDKWFPKSILGESLESAPGQK